MVFRVHRDWEEILSCFLFEQGSQGLHIREESAENTVLAAYFAHRESFEEKQAQLQEAWSRLYAAEGRTVWTILDGHAVPLQDWTTEWRKDYHPIPVGATFLIQPSWLPLPEAERRTAIILDPGNAFGSGTHASTQLCLIGIEEFHQSGQKVLDVGCGSGILAIAAALREKSEIPRRPLKRSIWAIEPDWDAMDTARRNARRNKVNHLITFRTKALEDLPVSLFSLIVANLTTIDIQNLAPKLCVLSAPQGLLLLSGLEIRDIRSVLDSFHRLGFRKIKVRTRQGWALLVLQKQKPPSVTV